MENAIVKTISLKKHYNAGTRMVAALDGVDFEVGRREFVSVIGKSGCGKSTLLHMIGGLDVPDSGTVVVDGMNLSEMNQEQLALFRRRKAGFIFQQYNLIPDLSVYDNIIFPLELDGVHPGEGFVRELLSALHIADKAELFINGERVFAENVGLNNNGYWTESTPFTPGIGSYRCGVTLSNVSLTVGND